MIISDPELRDAALEDFVSKAPAKFNKGMAEHNPDGTRGLMRMSPEALIDCMEEEVIDQWHYTSALKNHLKLMLIYNADLKARLASMEALLINQNSTTAKTNTPKPLAVSNS